MDSRAPHPSLKVLLVAEPGVNGVFRHVQALAHFLHDHGHRVDLAFSDVRGSDELEKLVQEVRAAGGVAINMKVGNAPGWRDLPALMRLRRLVHQTRPDVIHAHSSKAGALVRALPWLGVSRPLFYTPHAYYGMGKSGGLKEKIFTAIERVLGRTGATLNLSGCELGYAEKTLRIPRGKLRLIPNPVDAHRFVPPASAAVKSDLRREAGLPETALVLGSIGRLSFQKDPLTLYRGLALALREEKNLFLYHLGTGELDGECIALARELGVADRIVRRDYMREPLTFYQSVDAVVLASRYEGLSFAVLEAMACDLPLILSEAPGNLDFLSMGLSHCWSAPRENPEELGRAMVRWARDRAVPRPSNHRAVALEKFSPEACFGQVLAEYQQVVRPGP